MDVTKLMTGVIEGVSASIEVLRVKPGDVVVLLTDRRMSWEQARQVKDILIGALPDGVKSLVLDNGIKLAVLTSE